MANTDLLRSEEDTKRVLVVPFVEALGYDTRNPAEFASEISFPGGRVDYAILRDGNPVIIVECKPVSNDRLINNLGQLRGYFNSAKADVAILTNGIQYQFFAALDRDGEMDSGPFLEVNLDGFDDEDFGDPGAPELNALSVFTKAEYSSDVVREAATGMKYKSGIRRFLTQQFSGDELGTGFAELLARKVYDRNLTPRVKENLSELSKEVIAEFKTALVKSAATGRQHTPDRDELNGYFIVKNILWNVVDEDRIEAQDHATYCTIQLDGSNRKRICLLRFNRVNSKRLGLLDKDAEEQVQIGSLGEINNYAERIRARARQILANEK